MEKTRCFKCGYDKHLGSLHIHHIDGNHNNNEELNLVVLCANCHMEHHQSSPRKPRQHDLDKRNKYNKQNNIIIEMKQIIEDISFWKDRYEKCHHEDLKQITFLQEQLKNSIGFRKYDKIMKEFRGVK